MLSKQPGPPLSFHAEYPVQNYHLNTVELSYVISCYFDQNDCQSLYDLLDQYLTYNPALLEKIEFVIVDDCSPVKIEIPSRFDLNIRTLRILDDIPWNQGGGRNLGVVYAKSDKIIATDLDHVFPQASLERMLAFRDLGKSIYRFRRQDSSGTFTKPHPNTFLMSRGRFLKFFGVDEEFCGAYGSEDGMFWRWQRFNGTRFRFLNKKYPVLQRNYDREHSDHSLVRDTTRNHELKKRKKLELERWGPAGCHSRKFLAFRWELIEDRKRSVAALPPERRLWKKFWWLRWLSCR